jgi:hypothetical protein
LGRSFTSLQSIADANLTGINQIKHLHISALGWEFCEACNAQNALFILLEQLGPHHKLHELNVEIWPNGHLEWIKELGEDIPECEYLQTWQVAAFITDTLRNIRLKPIDGSEGSMMLQFAGSDTKLGHTLQSNLQTLMRSDSNARDFQAFHRYEQILTKLLAILRDVTKYPWVWPRYLTFSRVMTDVGAFREEHKVCPAVIRRSVDSFVWKWKSFCYEWSERCEEDSAHGRRDTPRVRVTYH